MRRPRLIPSINSINASLGRSLEDPCHAVQVKDSSAWTCCPFDRHGQSNSVLRYLYAQADKRTLSTDIGRELIQYALSFFRDVAPRSWQTLTSDCKHRITGAQAAKAAGFRLLPLLDTNLIAKTSIPTSRPARMCSTEIFAASVAIFGSV